MYLLRNGDPTPVATHAVSSKPWIVPIRPGDVLAVAGQVALQSTHTIFSFDPDVNPSIPKTIAPPVINLQAHQTERTGQFFAVAHGAPFEDALGIELHITAERFRFATHIVELTTQMRDRVLQTFKVVAVYQKHPKVHQLFLYVTTIRPEYLTPGLW